MQSVFSTKSMKEKRATLFWEETPNAFNTKAYIVPSGSPGSAFRLVPTTTTAPSLLRSPKPPPPKLTTLCWSSSAVVVGHNTLEHTEDDMSSVGRRPRPHLIYVCVSKKKRPLKTTKSSSSSSITTTTTKKASRLFSRERERVFVVAKRFVTTMKNWRQQIRLHFSNSIIYIYIQKQNERERVVCEHAHGKEESLGMPPNDDDNTTTTIASEEENEKEEARRHRA